MQVSVAEMLLKQMNESSADFTFYRGQKITRRYIRHILWKSYSYEDHRKALIQASRVLPLPKGFGV